MRHTASGPKTLFRSYLQLLFYFYLIVYRYNPYLSELNLHLKGFARYTILSQDRIADQIYRNIVR